MFCETVKQCQMLMSILDLYIDQDATVKKESYIAFSHPHQWLWLTVTEHHKDYRIFN